jgi:hypothetical protein
VCRVWVAVAPVLQPLCPLRAAEKLLVSSAAGRIAEAEVTAKMAREAADKAAAQAVKAEGMGRDGLTAEAIALAQAADSLEVPAAPRLLADDSTPQTVTTLSSDGAATFRTGDAPPLHGTLAALSERELALYATGSIEFYRTYPGMYIPRPIGIRPVIAARDPRELAAEVLALTKMNWNQTRLDGRLPVTLRTVNQVKSVLRFYPPDQAVATRYVHYI